MAITVTDNRTEIDAGDATTGWSSPVAAAIVETFTIEPSPKEASAHNGIQVSNEEAELLHTHTSTDLSAGVLFYAWSLAQGIMQTTTNYGVAAVLGDGTNTNAYQIGGADAAVFRHSSGSSVNYQCLLIDSASLPTGKALRGTFASFNNAAVTEFGVNYVTTVKSVGNVENCFVDKILYGNGGLTITGTDTASGFLDDLAVLDAASTTGGSYGGCRSLGAGVYGVQIRILIGDTGTGTDTLSIVSQTFKIENFSGVSTDKFGITVQGNATGTQTIAFTDSVLFCPLGTGAFITASDVNVDSFDVSGCLIQNFDQGIAFSTDATNGPNHDISSNTFIGCSQINSGKTAFSSNTINSSTDATGAYIIDSNTSLTNVSGLTFISDGTGHAIYITAAGSYTLTDFIFTGFSTTQNENTDSVIYNNSGGLVTVTISGGSGSVTYRNGASASTTIISGAVDVTVKAVDKIGDPIENARVHLRAADDTGGLPYLDSVTTITRVTTTASVSHTAHGLATGDKVLLRGITDKVEDNVTKTVSNVTVNAYDYITTDSGSTSYTGTITATYVALEGLTTVSGILTTNRVFSSDQPVIGWSRKSTASPYYQQGILSGDISSTTGYDTVGVMVDDE
jgi:hypothetical protein